MKKILLFLIVIFSMLSCYNDDKYVCDYYYSGVTEKKYNQYTDKFQYFMGYLEKDNPYQAKRIEVEEKTYSWIHEEEIKRGYCINIKKLQID